MNQLSRGGAALPFELFASFERIPTGNPVFYCEPPEWAAAAHAIVVDDTVHYLWARRRVDNYWVLMHSTAPTSDPTAVTHDPRNPVLLPSTEAEFDNFAVEYPFPFWNPIDQRFYAYYLGRQLRPPKQTGLLVSNGADFGDWTRVSPTPVISVEPDSFDYELKGSSHPSVAVVDDTIHILYTGESAGNPVICHATAPLDNPAAVTKNPANPIFTSSGEAWDAQGVREAELFKGPEYFHIFYGGRDGSQKDGVWRAGHVRTRDFHTFEANPHNPIFTPSTDRSQWDCDGILTPQVFEAGGSYYMLYAGMKGREWQSGLAKVSQ
ncbi:MAG: hypothetical protein AAF639_28005 [Chloroflexota bacterium]